MRTFINWDGEQSGFDSVHPSITMSATAAFNEATDCFVTTSGPAVLGLRDRTRQDRFATQVAAQFVGEVVRGGEAFGSVFFQALQADGFEVFGNGSVQAARAGGASLMT